MNRKKRLAVIFLLIVSAMLILPLITVNTVRADAGMLVTLVLFFALYPILSVAVGIVAGKDIKHFWFSPLLISVLFWLFSSVTYQTAFPYIYSVIYLTICTVSMLLTWTISGKR